MNFDGKAFVKNINVKNFISEHGHAFVIHENEYPICIMRNRSEAFVYPLHTNNPNILNNTKIHYSNGLIPYTVQVYKEKEYESLKPQTFMCIRNAVANDKQNPECKIKEVYVSKLQSTNIKYNPKSAIVLDSEQKESVLTFAGVSVNVNSKVQVVIPEKITDYSDMSIVVQKNCFIEIKLSDSVIDVTNLPDALMYMPGYIKGTFTQSGEYNVKIKYPDGEQIINIIVPYYQRLL